MAQRSARRTGAVSVAWVVGCLLLGIVAIGSGLDRNAFMRPAAARKVPSAFAQIALQTRGQAELLAGNKETALDIAEASVRRAPIDPVSPALLGAARMAIGDPVGAERAFRVAGQMGWRVPLTQTYWMEQAMVANDWRVAAERLDALLREQPGLSSNGDLFTMIEARPQGRKAIVDRQAMARSPWLETYATSIYDAPADVVISRAPVFAELGARGILLGCDPMAQAIKVLVREGLMAQAQDLWRMHCPLPDTALLADQNFAALRASGARSAFEWDMIGNSDVGLAALTVPGGKGQLISISDTATAPRRILRQALVIGPGTYRLTWQARDSAGKPSGRIAASLSCSPEGEGPVPGHPNADGRSWQADLRTGGECQAKWLVVSVMPGVEDVQLGGFKLDKI